jgi:hypothetical protein
VASVESDFCSAGEINTALEWLFETLTGQSNNTDEDGDAHDACNSHKTLNIFSAQQLLQSLEMCNLQAVSSIKLLFPKSESIPDWRLAFRIDHPPKLV